MKVTIMVDVDLSGYAFASFCESEFHTVQFCPSPVSEGSKRYKVVIDVPTPPELMIAPIENAEVTELFSEGKSEKLPAERNR